MPRQHNRRRQNASRQRRCNTFESTSYLSSVVSSPNTPFIKSLCCTTKFSEKSCVQLTTSATTNLTFSNVQKEVNSGESHKTILEEQLVQSSVILKSLTQKYCSTSNLEENQVDLELKNAEARIEKHIEGLFFT